MRQQHNELDMLEEAWSAAISVLFFAAGWIAANTRGGGLAPPCTFVMQTLCLLQHPAAEQDKGLRLPKTEISSRLRKITQEEDVARMNIDARFVSHTSGWLAG